MYHYNAKQQHKKKKSIEDRVRKWLFVCLLKVHTWTESALTISPLRRFASFNARRLLPEPVGPEITITFSFVFVADAVTRNRRRQMKESGDARNRGLSRKRRHVRKLHTPLFIIFGVSGTTAQCNCICTYLPWLEKISKMDKGKIFYFIFLFYFARLFFILLDYFLRY